MERRTLKILLSVGLALIVLYAIIYGIWELPNVYTNAEHCDWISIGYVGVCLIVFGMALFGIHIVPD